MLTMAAQPSSHLVCECESDVGHGAGAQPTVEMCAVALDMFHYSLPGDEISVHTVHRLVTCGSHQLY
jgi:hypothetical protein